MQDCFNIGEHLDLGQEVEDAYQERLELEKLEKEEEWQKHKEEIKKKGICQYCESGPSECKSIWYTARWGEEQFICWHCYSHGLQCEGDVSVPMSRPYIIPESHWNEEWEEQNEKRI